MKKSKVARNLAIISIVVVLSVVVAAVIILDPPALQRQRRMDGRRVRDLITIAQSIDSYWERKKSLPLDLTTLEMEPGLKIPRKDPETGLPYFYETQSTKSYRLCAVFSVDSSEESQEYNLSRKWSHGAGRQCFDLKPRTKEGKTDVD
jgi:hypothetical protein